METGVRQPKASAFVVGYTAATYNKRATDELKIVT